MEQVGGIQNATSAGGNLLIAQPRNLVAELAVPTAGIDYMRMRIAESRHHPAAFRINHLIKNPAAQSSIALSLPLSGSERGNDSVLNHKPGVVNARDGAHIPALEPTDAGRQNAAKAADIAYQYPHIEKGKTTP